MSFNNSTKPRPLVKMLQDAGFSNTNGSGDNSNSNKDKANGGGLNSSKKIGSI